MFPTMFKLKYFCNFSHDYSAFHLDDCHFNLRMAIVSEQDMNSALT